MSNVKLGKKFIAGTLLDLADNLIGVVNPEDDPEVKRFVSSYGKFLVLLAKREIS